MANDETPTITFPAPPPGTIEGPTGPPGPQGIPGKPEFSGQGPPGAIVGAWKGAKYLDELTGEIYTMNG